jgi:hypothetical protein
MTACPRCGEHAADGQEYCLECGARLAGGLAPPSDPGGSWILRALLAAVVAVAGAAVAIAATNSDSGAVQLTTAIGGFTTARGQTTLPAPARGGASSVSDWPAGADGWTIVLGSFPQTGGRTEPNATARRARARGLTQVGILDSSQYASLHPGYWLVFTGIYGSDAEATSALERARKVSRLAAVRHVVP